MGLIEDYRARVISDLFSMDSVSSVWPGVRAAFHTALPQTDVTPLDVLNLGRILSTTFTGLYQSGPAVTLAEAQSLVSRGGALWEAMVVWYLNLCLAGTRAVAIKKKGQMPPSVKDALSVWIGNAEKLSEPDVVVLHLDHGDVDAGYTGNPVAIFKARVDARFTQVNAINVQCKTNWNDAVQTPLLWNILYTAARTQNAQAQALGAATITFGQAGHYLAALGGFRYGFVTVPTNDLAGFVPQCSPVIRGNAFTGGCYWGRPSAQGVCRCIAEFFNTNGPLLPPIQSIGVAASQCLNGQGPGTVQFDTFHL